MKKIQIIKYQIKSNKIKGRIIQISDLHYYREKDIVPLNFISKEIEQLKPDYICITGDFLDNDKVKADPFIQWVSNLKAIAPVIISIGNHDTGNVHLRTLENSEIIFRALNRIDNVEVLNNRKKVINNICFTGITIPDEAYHENRKSNLFFKESLENSKLRKLDKKRFNLLLCHTPYVVVDKNIQKMELFKDSDLILCGHTHGGLTPKKLYHLLGNRVLMSPIKRILVKYSQGYYPEYHMIVNTAIKKLAHSSYMEIFDRFTSSEITVIDIE